MPAVNTPSLSSSPSSSVPRSSTVETRQPGRAGALFVRFVIVLLAVGAVLFLLGFLKYRQIQAAIAMGALMAPPPAAVTTEVVHGTTWQPTVRAIGTLEAVQGVTVSADLPGVVKEILFESGKTTKAGDILVRLVTDEEQAMLDSAQAQRDLKVLSLQRERDLIKSHTASQSEFDTADAEYRQAEAAVAQAKAAIERKTIRAPFDGVLGIRLVNVGQYLNSGDKIVPLQSTDPIFADFSLPQQSLSRFGVGSAVQVTTDATGDTAFPGKITALNSMVDSSTRNFQSQATIANPGARLHPGMFANVDVILPEQTGVLTVPSSAISYAPYGDSVFVVTQITDPVTKKTFRGVRQQFVRVGQTRGDLVAVETGIKEGQEVVTSGVFKLQNNAPVQINNSVQPEAEDAPHPEES
jgi:membrane fusion protein (multidrug efflux system)